MLLIPGELRRASFSARAITGIVLLTRTITDAPCSYPVRVMPRIFVPGRWWTALVCLPLFHRTKCHSFGKSYIVRSARVPGPCPLSANRNRDNPADGRAHHFPSHRGCWELLGAATLPAYVGQVLVLVLNARRLGLGCVGLGECRRRSCRAGDVLEKCYWFLVINFFFLLLIFNLI